MVLCQLHHIGKETKSTIKCNRASTLKIIDIHFKLKLKPTRPRALRLMPGHPGQHLILIPSMTVKAAGCLQEKQGVSIIAAVILHPGHVDICNLINNQQSCVSVSDRLIKYLAQSMLLV